MVDEIKVSEVYDKNLNFLIGSGASYGLFPTLSLGIQGAAGAETIETLASQFEATNDARLTPLFMHYYSTCIRPAQELNRIAVQDDPQKQAVLANYESFLTTVLRALQRRQPFDKRCNVFTTNYDSCFSLVADELINQSNIDFVLNDGARGFSRRYLQARNFNSYLCQTGIFERHTSSIPQINLVHLHGSAYWRKDANAILVDYSASSSDLLSPATLEAIKTFSKDLLDPGKNVDDLANVELDQGTIDAFWASYRQLPIVNPTKWKFHETVFEEHYYQMLRFLSYELEKPGAILITFGFSFADEHILNLIKRSLSNPTLQVFVCCFSEPEKQRLSSEFKIYGNVRCIGASDGKYLDFKYFNDSVFNLGYLETQTPSPAPRDDGA